jgi:hypothetical protein
LDRECSDLLQGDLRLGEGGEENAALLNAKVAREVIGGIHGNNTV